MSKIFVTVDIVLLKKENTEVKVLLIKRKNEPFKDKWALPGGFVDENEDLMVAAKRELLEETTIDCKSLSQLGAYGKPFRDPRSHVVSVAYIGLVDTNTKGKAADDAKELDWFSLDELPELAFDHGDILQDAIKKAIL
ncbi:NUDIX domain-containing protein [Myroides sp. LoEW2-1]|uniref:NUDIX domain-containing protein n=1 Tax=Myroides sp. LoEW2-1 TaxID=2683192 RepID=UPI001327F5B3|nr:NUDIX hydrolase [Myroides sp. LoEW2-1]MVX37263.1 NUDIX domain-containing protein [Myroides sp. LoEW2-1]